MNEISGGRTRLLFNSGRVTRRLHLLIAVLLLLSGSHGAMAKESLVGKQCRVSHDDVVVSPDITAVESWPDIPGVKKNLMGLESIKSHIGTVVFKTRYDVITEHENPYWRHRDVYIVKVDEYYFLVVEEGLSKCKKAARKA